MKYGRQKGSDGWMMVEVYGLTEVGKKRELNEDNFKICGFEEGKAHGFCVLADGMGGHNAGEIASESAVEIISNELMPSLIKNEGETISLDIAEAIDFANSKIYEMSLSCNEQAGMGTTTVVSYVNGKNVIIANIGDSRAYVVSKNEIFKITVDHSIVEQLIESGTITREEAKVHPDKNIITRALGTEEYVDADFYEYDASDGEAILMCSDGLTEMLDEAEIKEIVFEADNVKSAAEKLIELANDRGGVDNITVILMMFKGEENNI